VLCITSSITFISQFGKKSTSDRKAQVIDKQFLGRASLSPKNHDSQE
jgi:hypothetical protein